MKDSEKKSEIGTRLEQEMQIALDQIRQALEGLRFGQITIVVHDGVMVQIDRTEKRRLRSGLGSTEG